MPPISVLVALADATRCRIIEILRDGPQPVHILAASFKISRPAISRHLRVLKQARLISEKKTGRENRYALHAEKLKPVGEWVATMRQSTASEQHEGNAARKPALKKAVSTTAGRNIEAVPLLANPLEPVPASAVSTPTIAAKPRREAPVSQMGFDF